MRQIKRIMAVINDFGMADAILSKAAALSQREQAKLEVMFVHEEKLFDLPEFFRFKEIAPNQPVDKEKIQKEITQKLTVLGVKESVPVLVFVDDTADHVLLQTKNAQETLIILSYDKNIARKVIKKSHLPVLVIKHNRTVDYAKVVVPVDFSPASKESIVLAKALFPQKQIELVHDYRALYMEGFMDSEGMAELGAEVELTDMEKKAAEDNFEALLQEMQCKGSFLTEKASFQEDLSDFILDNGHDLAIIGSNNADKLFFDSVSFDLLETLPIDLLIYSPQSL